MESYAATHGNRTLSRSQWMCCDAMRLYSFKFRNWSRSYPSLLIHGFNTYTHPLSSESPCLHTWSASQRPTSRVSAILDRQTNSRNQTLIIPSIAFPIGSSCTFHSSKHQNIRSNSKSLIHLFPCDALMAGHPRVHFYCNVNVET